MSEEQLEKKRARDRERRRKLREEKVIKPIAEMKAADQKKTRKSWKKYSATYRKKQKDLRNATENTPPSSENEDFVEPKTSRQKERGRKQVRRDRTKAYRKINKQKEEILNLKRSLEKYKKRYQREKNKSKDLSSPSPNKRVRELVGTERVSPQIKKTLFASFVLQKQLKSQMKACSSKGKEKQIMCKVVGSKILKKYRTQKCFKELIPYKFNKVQNESVSGKPDLTYSRQKYKTVRVKEVIKLRKFFEDDSVSKMCPGKKDFVRKGKKKVQRRILLNTMKNLFTRFSEENPELRISYSTFTRSRPFWVTAPNSRDRETCACVHHENFEFLVNSLRSAKVITETSSHDILKSLVCSVKNEKCMLKLCNTCKTNEIKFDLSKRDPIKYFKWETINEERTIKGAVKVIKRVIKNERVAPILEVIDLFKKALPFFQKHVHAMIHQSRQLKNAKENLKEGELIFQVDFSQNYIAKHGKEIQSMHFGASKRQISLHTGVQYHHMDGKVVAESFCTVSDNLDHHCYGVWAHLRPILEDCFDRFPTTHTVHFFSDSPSSQYRNRGNIHFMSKLLPKFFQHLKCFTWNFSEPGHGKGPMDGVGGSIKRNADQHVNQGADINSAADLVDLYQNNSLVKITEIKVADVEEMKESLPTELPALKGIMQVRQLCFGGGQMTGRKLSCFVCAPQKKCKHFHLVNIDIKSTTSGNPVVSTVAGSSVLKKRKLSVDDVYSSSSSDEEPCSSSSSDKEPVQKLVKKKVSPVKCTPITNTNMDSALQQGTYVVVSLETGKQKRKKLCNFVAVLQSNIDSLNDVKVMFMKQSAKDNSLYVVDENDVSHISISRIVGVLPLPSIVAKGSRLFYKFQGPVAL